MGGYDCWGFPGMHACTAYFQIFQDSKSSRVCIGLAKMSSLTIDFIFKSEINGVFTKLTRPYKWMHILISEFLKQTSSYAMSRILNADVALSQSHPWNMISKKKLNTHSASATRYNMK